MSANSDATVPLEIRLLGPMRIALNGITMRLSSRKGQWLLALLALRQGREVARDWLAATLWPDNEEQQALFNLRQCLPHLRRALGAEASRLSSPTPRTLCLDLSGAFTDVAVFDTAIAEDGFAALERAVALYVGQLLEGCGEEWILADRRAREEGFLQALEKLGMHAMAQSRPSTAIGCFRRFLATDPYRESMYGALMEALADAGDYAAVTQTYCELRLLLHNQLQSSPSAEIQSLFELLRTRGRLETSGVRTETVPRAAKAPVSSSPFPDSHPPNNLPRQFTRFIGREQERSELEHRLASASLVTLVGTGGAGKTRLALQMAADLLETFPGGVWFVEFAALTDAALLAQSVADVLGIDDEPNRPLLETLTDTLRPKRLLLILDNCEHLLEACAHLASALLRACPKLCLLATSREALHITGEAVYRVPSLSLPAPFKRPAEALENAQQSEAVCLFVERAEMVRPPFALTEGNAEALIRICRRLDGIPLALELAAARTGALTPEQIAQRLEDRFRLLSGGSRDVLPRHRTLEALIDWSYDLLSAEERVLFHRLAVFAGGWTLEAAEALCKEETTQIHRSSFMLHPFEVAELLMELVEKSLVLFEVTGSGEGRYRFLESVREYALYKLRDSGERDALRERHCDFFLALTEEAKSKMNGPEQVSWLEALERDHDNLRLALTFCEEAAAGQAEKGLMLTAALQGFWWMRGPLSEGKAHYAALLAHPDTQEPTLIRADALHGAGGVASLQGDHLLARALWEEERAIRQQLGDQRGLSYSLSSLAMVAKDLGDYAAARTLYKECLAIQTSLGDRRGRAVSLGGMAILAANEGDYVAAREGYTESLTLNRELGNTRGIAVCLGDLGAIARLQGDYETAHILLEEGLSLQRELGNRTGTAILLLYLALTATDLADYVAAHLWFAECLTLQQELGNRTDLAGTLEAFAVLVSREDKPLRAARFWGAAEALRESTDCPRQLDEREAYHQEVTKVRTAVAEEAFSTAWAEGRAMSLEQIVAYALSAM